MRAILLDGSQANDSTGERVCATLTAELQARGWDVEHVLLRESKIGNCAGDFFCWIRTPGVCNLNDDNRAIAEAVIASDLMVFLTPITFGGYSSTLKRMVDHLIQNISPFFSTVAGETHHQKRYKNYPDFLAVGWLDAPDTQAQAVFRHLAQRNAINFCAKNSASGVILASQSDREMVAVLQDLLKGLQNGRPPQAAELPVSGVADNGTFEVRRALLLVGSPKTRKSTSNSLGSYLFEQLNARSVRTETIYLHTVLRSPKKMQALLEAVDAVDLVTLAFPLYVDTLPAPVIEGLERIAAHRQGRDTSRRQLFSAIANCGFPEAQHNATALAVCETFACQAGFEWAGSLALGGGQAINGTPLAEMDGRVIPIIKSLELAAEVLAQGGAIPQTAQEILAKPAIPHWAYRLLGGIGWRQQAKRYSAQKSLRQQPYLAKAG